LATFDVVMIAIATLMLKLRRGGDKPDVHLIPFRPVGCYHR
jgi:hypothetical protein